LLGDVLGDMANRAEHYDAEKALAAMINPKRWHGGCTK
jgi:hypothetical protein